MGNATDQELVPLAEVLGWMFYGSAEQMRFRCEAYFRRHDRCTKDSPSGVKDETRVTE